MSQNCIDKLIYLWKKKTILRACFIQVGIVYADVPFFVGFSHHNDISKPIEVMGHSDEVYHEVFVHLFINDLLSLEGEWSLLLSHQLDV